MNRVDRLMGILTTLQSHKFVPAEKLCKKYNISIRTVYRDVRALDEIGIPVSFQNGKGYFIVEGYFLPPVSFTPGEANALVLLASLAERFGDRSVSKNATAALEKIRSVLRTGDKDRTNELANRIRVLDPNPPTTPADYLEEIQNAIATNTILRVEYTDANQRNTSRELEPIGMIHYTERWHLIAWCWMRKDYRDFIVKNIRSLKTTAEPFRKKDHITVDEHIKAWATKAPKQP